MSIRWEGVSSFRKQLDVDAVEKFRGPLKFEAELIMTAAKQITPKKTGALVGSGHVKAPKASKNLLSITLGFGGAASAYALVQHERTDFAHRGKQQAKFLEQPVKAAQKGFASRLERHLDLW